MREARHHEMRGRGLPRRAVIQFAGLRFHELDEFLDVARGRLGLHNEQIGGDGHHRERLEIGVRVVVELRIRGDGDCMRRGGAHGERVPSGAARATSPVAMVPPAPAFFDHDLLAEAFAELLSDYARDRVGVAAGAKPTSRRIGLLG